MKNLLIIFFFVFFCLGCDPEQLKKEREEANIQAQTKVYQAKGRWWKEQWDQHVYVIRSFSSSQSMDHDPDCPCSKKK